jgi:AraC-like DNA-binding protein
MLVLIPGPADSLHIRLFSVGYIPLDRWWTHTDRIRSMWRLCRADNEGASLLYDSSEFKIPAGKFCLVPPGLKFKTHLQRKVPLFFVHFEVVSWPITTVQDLVPEPITLAPDEFRDRFADQLSSEVSASDHLGSALSCRVKSLVHLAMATLEENLAGEKASLMRHVVDGQLDLIEVLQFIDRHIDQPLDNKRLADIAHSSESCFIRHFREVTGQTPARYVQDRRVAHASELLVCTDYSIDDVAQRCGFANRFYFSRVFSERMGRPPARYRNERPVSTTLSRQQG